MAIALYGAARRAGEYVIDGARSQGRGREAIRSLDLLLDGLRVDAPRPVALD